ncbi:MAG: hypothetical protein COV99_04970 [Bacteroidetes bacterium CG12_big_fil_rev_8_21_14_0_65_60_17]|nr:MAG: hypothetical protein COV99_04970 [Bacteroidetes bacterium CG12_big_fil_rev_8_21_14_0_65_60_17]
MSKLNTIIRAGALAALMIAIFGVGSSSAQAYKEAFNAGAEAAKAKNYAQAVEKFVEAADGAAAEGDDRVEAQARGLIAKIEYNVARALIQNESFEQAIAHLDTGIEQDPNFAKNYLAKAATLKKLDRWDDAVPVYQKAIEVGNATADTQTARTAQQALRDQYVYLASSTLSNGSGNASRAQAQQALEYLDTLQTLVEPDADALYYMAEANKVLGNYGEAIRLADEALEIHRGSRTDKAKIYFVKGEALMSTGKASEARSAFENASYGSYRASAQHFLETLGTN